MMDPIIPLRRPQTTIEKLPDEILDMVMRTAFAGCILVFNTTSGEPRWYPQVEIVSVCRRWSKIAVPYAYRHIHVTSGHLSPEEDKEDDSFVTWVIQNSYAAKFIQELSLENICLGMSAINSLFELLPHLRSLSFDHVWILGDYDGPKGQHKLDKLAFRKSCVKNAIGVPDITAIQLFQLFSEIGDLQVANEFNTFGFSSRNASGMDRVISPNSVGELRIRKLTLDYLSVAEPYYLVLPPKLNVLRHVTSLSVKSYADYKVAYLLGLLVAVAPTLNELTLHLYVYCDPNNEYDSYNSEFVERWLSGALAICNKLHGFELSVCSPHWYDDGKPMPSYTQMAADGWQAACDIFPLIPTDNLKHVTFHYWSQLWHPEVIPDFDAFRWEDLRRVLRRFKSVESIEVVLESIDAVFNEVEEWRERGRECFFREMAEFGEVLYSSNSSMTRMCEQESCKWYERR